MILTISLQGADLIIALTHMRVPNDMRLLESDADIDLILGGHDHHYEVKKVWQQSKQSKTLTLICIHSNRHKDLRKDTSYLFQDRKKF